MKSSKTVAKTKTATAKATPAKKPTGGVEGILAAFGAREGTNRAKLLTRLARDIGRPVPLAALSEAVYGKASAPRAPLAMVMRGALMTARTKKPGYQITQIGGRGDAAAFTLSAVR